MSNKQSELASGGQIDPKLRGIIARAPTFDMHSHLGRFFAEDGDFESPVAAMRAGAVTGCVASAIGDLPVLERTDTGMRAMRFPEAGELFRSTSRQLDRLDDTMHRSGLVLARTTSAIRDAAAAGKVVMVAGIEGGDFLERNLAGVEWAFGRGVRLIQLVHYRVNCLGDIQTEAPRYGGLTDLGSDVIGEMDRLGMIVDVAHATLFVTEDVAERSRNPILLSHTLIGDAHPRMISVEHARIVAETGGVVGAWPSALVVRTLDTLVDGILRLVEAIGIDHVGIGTDQGAIRDSVFGNYARFDLLVAALLGRGLSEEDVGKIIGGNFLRLFERVVGGSSLNVPETTAR